MAVTKYLDYDGLLYFWTLIKAKLADKADKSTTTSAGSYGPSADVSATHGGNFKVPYVTVNSQGIVTGIADKTVTLPSDNDTKVKQNLVGTSDTKKYPVLLKNSNTATDSVSAESKYVAAITVQPSTGTVEATKFKGTMEGNADTATAFASAQSVTLTGDVTGTTSSTAGWSIATTLANSGVTAGTIGNNTQQTPSHGGTFNIPYVTVDAKGRVTAGGTTTVKLPSDNNTDTLVTQNVSTANEEHPILLTVTKDAASNQGAKTSIFASGVKVNPSTETVTATKFKGAVEGNADSATEFASTQTVALTGDVTGSASSKAGWSVATTLSNSGVTAGSYGPSANATPAYGATFNVPYITVDAKGRVTAASTKTVKIPATDNTDTKVNVTLDTTHKAYLLGVTTAPTSTAQALESVSDTGVYLDTTAGRLTATSFEGNGQNITLNTASRAVVTDSNKKLAVSSVTATELGYVSGVTSAIQTQLNGKAASATTLAGYGITDAYTKTEIDTKLTSAMHYKGSVTAVADLPSTGNAVGDFYNVTATGENYAWTGSEWDVTGSIVDLQSITNAEIDTVVAS